MSDSDRGMNSDLVTYLKDRHETLPLWKEVISRAQRQSGKTSLDTPAEILQQPWLWQQSARLVKRRMGSMAGLLAGARHLYLTGAGSSFYIGRCLEAFLQTRLGIPVQAVATTDLILDPDACLAPGESDLVISFSRSGGSPESFEAARLIRERFPEYRQLLVTCNDAGGLAQLYEETPGAAVLAMHPDSCDKGLAMTGSFTTMLIAAQSLGFLGGPEDYLEHVDHLAAAATHLLDAGLSELKSLDLNKIVRVCLLGNGGLQGAALEGALKVLEMTDGRVATVSESFLGVRHGPLSFIDEKTLVVYFLSSGSPRRNYETDLMREIKEKNLGALRTALGFGLAGADELFHMGVDVADSAGLDGIPDDARPPLDVIFPQMLALLLNLHLGLDPDNPSRRGAINRVVQGVRIHRE
jgi:tagatose-6-phosphate ketose/aldose isomerase